MAEMQTNKRELEEFQTEYSKRNKQAEENRQRENQAATRMQSWFRGCKLRAHIRYLHKKATIIQTIWRGFVARAHARKMVKAAYFIMKMNFYKAMAVRIQQRWRGFFVRKYILNFYARKQYLERLSVKNNLLREKLDKIEELQRRKRNCVEMVNEQNAKVYEAHHLHHLLSTKQGLFREPGELWEQRMHCPELMLRVQTSYTHLEEAQSQLKQYEPQKFPSVTL